MAAPTLTVACLGAGYFSRFHCEAWGRVSQVRCIGVADHDITAAVATGLPAFADLSAMLDAEVPDILDIILPSTAQATAITKALEAGVRTIICQKPFCRDLKEAEAMTDRAEAAGTRLIVHENFRFMPWYRVIKTEITAGRIGTPLQASFRLRPGDGQGAQAYLDRQPYFRRMPRFLIHETGVHWIDTFRYLLGNPTAVYADLRRINLGIAGEDAGLVLFDHPSGARSLLDGNRSCDHAADNLRRTMGEGLFEGTAGALTLAGDGSVTFRAQGQVDVETVLPPDTWDGFGGDCVYHLQRHVVRAMLDGVPAENEARDYLEVIRIEEAIYRSAETGSKIALV